MKTLSIVTKFPTITIILMTCLSFTVSAQNSKKEKEAAHAALIAKMVEAKQYTFEVESALPSGRKTIHLSPGYIVRISGDTLISNLPYYGQAYSAAGVGESGYNFTSTSLDYSVTNRKKGGWEIDIKTKDQQQNPQFSFTIFENGNASLMVTSMNRQNIQYSGYIDDKK
jgi:hypothetical protein